MAEGFSSQLDWFWTSLSRNCMDWLVVWTMNFMTFHILGMSSSQLTNSYFSRWLKPPTSGIMVIIAKIRWDYTILYTNLEQAPLEIMAKPVSFSTESSFRGAIHVSVEHHLSKMGESLPTTIDSSDMTRIQHQWIKMGHWFLMYQHRSSKQLD